ncbi:MAG: hypothetical protein Kilf2KO_15070 [Rhodospirillales bacterium]
MTDERQSTAAIEREVEAERDRLADTAEALQQKLSIGSLVDEVIGASGRHGATFGRKLGRTVRDNPVPVTLLGLGLVWLMASGPDGEEDEDRQRSHDRRDGDGTTRPYAWPEPEASPLIDTAPGDDADPGAGSKPGVGKRVAAASERAKAAGSAAAEGARRTREAAEGAAHDAGERLHDLGDKVSDLGRDAKAGGLRAARRARGGFDRLLEDQPLVVGALALAVGAAIGGAVPNSRAENRLMGRQAADLRETARAGVKDEARKLKDVAKAAGAEAKKVAEGYAEAVDRKTPDGESVVGKVEAEATAVSRRIAKAAKEEADRVELGKSGTSDKTPGTGGKA